MRKSSLVERLCAENSRGLSLPPKLWISGFPLVVEERSIFIEVVPARGGGEYGSENAGMSSDKKGENPFHRKSKVS